MSRLPMRYAFGIVIVCGLLLTLAIGPKYRSSLGQRSPLEVVSETNIGTVVSPGTTDFSIKVCNAGSAPIQVTRVEASCGCTHVTNEAFSLAPQGTHDIPLRFSSEGREGKQTVTLKLSVAGFAPKEVPLACEVVPEHPEEVLLPSILPGKYSAADFLLRPRPPLSIIDVRDVRYDRKFLRVTLGKKGSEGMRVGIQPVTGLPVGPFATELVLNTNDTEQPLKRIVVRGTVFGRVKAQPDSISIGNLAIHQRLDRRVTISSTVGQPFRILGVKCQPDIVVAEVDKDRSTTEHDLLLHIGSDVAGAVNSQVKVLTDAPLHTEVNIRLLGIIE